MQCAKHLLFVHSPAVNQIYGGQPTSLLYALAVLAEELRSGSIAGVCLRNLEVLNWLARSDRAFQDEYVPRFRQLLEQKRPKLIGFSNSILSQHYAEELVNVAKAVLPECVTVFGGAHETALEDVYLEEPIKIKPDLIICGDAEYLLSVVAKTVIASDTLPAACIKKILKERRTEISQLPGRASLIFRDRGGKADRLQTAGRQLDLNSLPFMPRCLLDSAKDDYQFSIFSSNGKRLKTAQVITYRGCFFAVNPKNACTFCFIDRFGRRSVTNVSSELEILREQGYEAVFFDDGTFTNTSTARKKELKELSRVLRELGFKQWGFQTRVDFVDEEILQTVKGGGCRYIAYGLESADEKLLGLVGKKATLSHAIHALELTKRADIQAGIYTIFGAPNEQHYAYESQKSIDETISFLKTHVENGTIREVLPNLLAYLPGTRLSKDYRDKNGCHPKFKPEHCGFPWNRFELGFAAHPEGINEKRFVFDGQRLSLPEYVVKKASKELGAKFLGQDYYLNDEIFKRYLFGKSAATDFNHAMLAKPLPICNKASANMDKKSKRGRLDANFIDKISANARDKAASLVNLKTPQNVILARNTTEALKVATGLLDLKLGDEVVTTNIDYEPTIDAFKYDQDFSNTNGIMPGYSFGTYSSKRARHYADADRIRTAVKVKSVDILYQEKVISDSLIQKRILEALTPRTKVVFLSHVIRDDGRILNVAKIAASVKSVDPRIFLVIDGAQALANVPQLDFDALGVDIYVAAAHKTLESHVLGIAYVAERVLENRTDLNKAQFPLLRGMLDPRIIDLASDGVMSTPEIMSFIAAVKLLKDEFGLQNNDFSRLDAFRRGLRERFLQTLLTVNYSINDTHCLPFILSPSDHSKSNYILSFRFPHVDNRSVVKVLWEEHGVFSSYIARTDAIRVSFGIKNTEEDIEMFFTALQQIQCDTLPQFRLGNTLQRRRFVFRAAA